MGEALQNSLESSGMNNLHVVDKVKPILSNEGSLLSFLASNSDKIKHMSFDHYNDKNEKTPTDVFIFRNLQNEKVKDLLNLEILVRYYASKLDKISLRLNIKDDVRKSESIEFYDLNPGFTSTQLEELIQNLKKDIPQANFTLTIESVSGAKLADDQAASTELPKAA